MPNKELTVFQIGTTRNADYRIIIAFRSDEEKIDNSLANSDEFIDSYSTLAGLLNVREVEIWKSVKEQHQRELQKDRYEFIETISRT